METTTENTRTPKEAAQAVHDAVTEINEVVSEGRRIITGINDKINADISAKYQIGEKHLRKVSNNEMRTFEDHRKELKPASELAAP